MKFIIAMIYIYIYILYIYIYIIWINMGLSENGVPNFWWLINSFTIEWLNLGLIKLITPCSDRPIWYTHGFSPEKALKSAAHGESPALPSPISVSAVVVSHGGRPSSKLREVSWRRSKCIWNFHLPCENSFKPENYKGNIIALPSWIHFPASFLGLL